MDLPEQFYQRACDALGFRHPFDKLSADQQKRVRDAAEGFATDVRTQPAPEPAGEPR